MRLLHVVLIAYLVTISLGSVERMMEEALKILPAVVKDPKKVEMFRGALISAKGCLDPIAQKAGEETVEKFLEVMFPVGADCSQESDSIEDLHTRRKQFSKCFYGKIDSFLEGKCQNDKDAFLEARKCFKEIFGDHE